MERSLYAWFDTEYSDLELDSARLLQVALVITDNSLHRVLPVDEDVTLAVRLPVEAQVSQWVKENLGDLEKRCRSGEAVEVEEADSRLCGYVTAASDLLKSRTNEEKPFLAGNSIHADWWLARRFLPRFLGLLHYRQIDVTSFKVEWNRLHKMKFDKENPKNVVRWFPEAHLVAEGRHDAYYDVQASIAELAFYRNNLFAPK